MLQTINLESVSGGQIKMPDFRTGRLISKNIDRRKYYSLNVIVL